MTHPTQNDEATLDLATLLISPESNLKEIDAFEDAAHAIASGYITLRTQLAERDAQLAEAIADATATLTKQRDMAVEALQDAQAGLDYIRQHHGDLYGVGFDRCAAKTAATLAAIAAQEEAEQMKFRRIQLNGWQDFAKLEKAEGVEDYWFLQWPRFTGQAQAHWAKIHATDEQASQLADAINLNAARVQLLAKALLKLKHDAENIGVVDVIGVVDAALKEAGMEG